MFESLEKAHQQKSNAQTCGIAPAPISPSYSDCGQVVQPRMGVTSMLQELGTKLDLIEGASIRLRCDLVSPLNNAPADTSIPSNLPDLLAEYLGRAERTIVNLHTTLDTLNA